MDTINIAIIDDEKVQVELLQKYVESWSREKNLRVAIEVFYSAEAFEFSWSMDKKYNIILLDVQMEGKSGIELAKKIRQKDELLNIIFITAITDYIAEGYDVSALNYLIKPVKESKLYECLDKAILKFVKKEKTMLIEVEGGTERIIQKDIFYVEAFAHSVEVYTAEYKYTTRKGISSIEKELDEDSFVRCHRSYIVGLRHIKRIGINELELDNGKIIPISRRQYSKTNMAFIRYFRGDINE